MHKHPLMHTLTHVHCYNATVQVLILYWPCHLNVTFYLYTSAATVMNSSYSPL